MLHFPAILFPLNRRKALDYINESSFSMYVCSQAYSPTILLILISTSLVYVRSLIFFCYSAAWPHIYHLASNFKNVLFQGGDLFLSPQHTHTLTHSQVLCFFSFYAQQKNRPSSSRFTRNVKHKMMAVKIHRVEENGEIENNKNNTLRSYPWRGIVRWGIKSS